MRIPTREEGGRAITENLQGTEKPFPEASVKAIPQITNGAVLMGRSIRLPFNLHGCGP